MSRACGCLTVAVAAMVIIGWYMHWPLVVQLHPNLPPMQYNTALGFLLCGSGLILHTTRMEKYACWLGGGATLLGGLTLLEYLFNLNLGIDQLFGQTYLRVATAYPGRMAPLTAACFVSAGVAIVLIHPRHPSRWILTIAGMLACAVSMIALITIGGYICGNATASGWGADSRMALNTAVILLVLSFGVIVSTLQTLRQETVNLFRWLLVSSAVTLLMMVGFLSSKSFTELKKATAWRNHSTDVLVTAQSLFFNVTKIQRSARSYILTVKPEALEAYQANISNATQMMSQLKMLTKDNPTQEQNLDNIARDLDQVIAYTQLTIKSFNEKGIDAVTKLGLTGQGLSTSNAFLNDVLVFTEAEKRLLHERTEDADTNFHNTERLLIFGAALAVALLALANYIANQELSYRREIETKLEERSAELERMARSLHENNIDLKNAATAKDRFISNMSHELRTPLNGIIGFSELLVDELPGTVNEEQKEYLQDILTSGQHLLQLINDVLDLAKLGTGKMDLNPEAFSLHRTIEQICAVVYPLSKKKGITITTVLEPGLDNVVLDQQKFKQVLYNLLSNAIKFSNDNGEVSIVLARQSEELFSMKVRDSGIGIRQDDIKRLFKEFEQIESSATRSYQGTGLGLALTRKIVEIQGGSIWVESEVGRGSTFNVVLPIVLKEAVT